MPENHRGWHQRWLHDSAETSEIDDGRFRLWTSTHDYYVFDVATGKMLFEFHLWRNLLRAGVLVVVLAIAAFVWRKVRRTQGDPLEAIEVAAPSPARMRFSLRSLLIFTTVVAGFFGLFGIAPRLAIFLLSCTISILLAVAVSRAQRRVRHLPRFAWPRWGTVLLALVCLQSWLLTYALSFPAALRMADAVNIPEDARLVIEYVPYGPLIWGLSRSRLAQHEAVQWYSRWW
jgi:hypothetical protein